jgi:hypothetical protein
MVLADWQVGQFFWSMLWFTLFFMWIWTVVTVFADIFRSRDLRGVSKAIWTLFVVFLPILGVLAYLIVRGDNIQAHSVADARASDEAMRSYVRSAAATPTTDLATLVDLRDRGVIDEIEFQSMKQKVVAT